MRVLLLVCAAGCGLPRVATPLPEPPPKSLAAIAPQLVAGEQTSWDVFLQGMPIGRAELVIGESTARSTFRTNRLARAITSIRYELATAFDRDHVRGARESMTIDGRTKYATTEIDRASYSAPGGDARVPGGTDLHTLHTALGVVRAWSKTNPTPGYLWLWNQGELHRLDVFRPTRDDVMGMNAWRIDGMVRTPHRKGTISVTVWLAANADRTPLRFAIRADNQRVTADVVESTSSFKTR